jgi:hypothetical protein
MLQVSDAAIVLLKDTLAAKGGEDEIFRLFLNGDAFALKMAAAEDGDIVYEDDEEGVAVLAAAPDLANGLGGAMTIDVEETDQGPRLIILAP